MTLVIRINDDPTEVHNCSELHIYFDKNIMEFVFPTEQDTINIIELAAIGFPENPLTLTIGDPN